MQEQRVHVAVAVIRNSENEILIAKRPDHVHQGGLWEFPGGKVESGEDTSMALKRELQEELGISVDHTVPFTTITYNYPDKHVYLDVHEIKHFDGRAAGLEGQSVKWVPVKKLNKYSFPPANKSILNSLLLPQQYMITGEYSSAEQFEMRLLNALDSGIRLIQYRDPDLPVKEYIEQAQSALSICHRYDAKLLLNTDPALFGQLNADGLHLTSDKLLQSDLSDLPEAKLCSASVHNEVQLEKANALELDFVVISPVLPTLSHPGANTLGWLRFKELLQMANMPVYALGGMQAEHLERALRAGAQGISAIRSFWKEK